MKKIILPIIFMAILMTGCGSSNSFSAPVEEFTFSLTWGCDYDSSYDSQTHILVKANKVIEHQPKEYITTYQYPNVESIYNKVKAMNIYSYPNLYDAYQGVSIYTEPNTNYLLKIGDKTIEAKDCPIVNGYPKGLTNKGKKYLELVFEIIDTVTGSEEWKALPDPEVLYL